MAESILDDPAAQDIAVSAVETEGTLAAAGARLRITGQAVGKYAKANAAFGDRIEAARRRFRSAQVRLPRPLPAVRSPAVAAEAMGVAVALVEDADAAPGPTVSQFIEECADLYRNTDEHPAVRAKALGIMAEYKLGGIAWVARKRAERELDQAEKSTDGEGPLVIARMPPKNPPPGEAIDVEVIDG